MLAQSTNPRLRPGQCGVLRFYEPDTRLALITWDDGTESDLHLHAGDRLDVLANPTPITRQAWQYALTVAGERARDDGLRAIERWYHTHDHQPAPAKRSTAQHVLAQLDSDDEETVILPRYPSSPDATSLTTRQLADLVARYDPSMWQLVSTPRWRQAASVYRVVFDATVRQHAATWCRRTLIPAANGRDLAAMRPDNLQPGRVGVFTGDWPALHPDDGMDALVTGYVGTFAAVRAGRAVFSCTRQVAEAIVTDHQRWYANAHARQGAEADTQLPDDVWMVDLWFDGDVIVAGQRASADDPAAVERITPDAAGQYLLAGPVGRWQAVDPYRSDRIVGDIPPADDQQVTAPDSDDGPPATSRDVLVAASNLTYGLLRWVDRDPLLIVGATEAAVAREAVRILADEQESLARHAPEALDEHPIPDPDGPIHNLTSWLDLLAHRVLSVRFDLLPDVALAE
jgi:hypothetical protein